VLVDSCTGLTTDGNHQITYADGGFTVTKADADCSWITGYTVTYDGNAHTATGSCKGVDGFDLAGLDLSGTTHTAAGTYDDDPWTFTDVTGNYNDTSGTVDDHIGKAPSTTQVSCPVSVTYTGSALTPCTASVSGAGGLSQSLSVSYANNTNAGTANASASYGGDANHLASGNSKDFTINKAPSSTQVTCPASVTYTGSALTPCTAAATGAGGLNVGVGVMYSNNVLGTATASASYFGDTNHLASSGSTTFLILYSSASCLGSPGRDILQPVNRDSMSTTSSFKKGSTVPVKFRVCDASGNSVGVPGLVTSFDLVRRNNGSGEETAPEDVFSTTPDTAFRWSSTDQQWIFNLSTKNLTAGYTYFYEISLNDGGPPIRFHIYLAK
jgi:hypothetical protein